MLFEPEHVIYVDGASRGNPGPASYGFAVFDAGGKLLHKASAYIGRTTNNVAEYTALIEALRYLLSRNISAVEIRSDSQLLVRQVTGEYKVRTPHIQELHDQARDLLRRFAFYQIKHVPRAENKVADKLANEALDRER